MTTSIDLSVDELLLLQENQYHMSNFVLANVKPIGAERKIGQSTNTATEIKSSLLPSKRPVHIDFVSRSIQENNNSFEVPTTMSIYDHFHFSPIDEPSIMNEYEFSTYPSFATYSSSSIAHSPRSPSHSIYQRQIPTLTTQISTSGSNKFCATQTYPPSRFYPPQHYGRNSFLNICQQTRSTPPAPFQCHRERFQVNSIGRPILRTNLLHGHNFKVRR